MKFWSVIFKLLTISNGWGISCEIALGWWSLYLTDEFKGAMRFGTFKSIDFKKNWYVKVPVVAAAADGSQDLTRRLTWGALSAKLNEATTLMPHISRTKRTDNMNFSTRIQKNILSQHAKGWYSRENIVLLGVVLTCHLGTCIPAKKRMLN